ncbi:5182_t:CDS:1, partial [Funneliformis caledonium]
VLTAFPALLLNRLRGVNFPDIFPANTLVFIASLKTATPNESP